MNTTVLFQPAATSRSALLTIDGLYLALPQWQIRAIETAAVVDGRDAEPLSVGWLRHAQQRWPVYCLSQELSLLAAVPAGRHSCVMLGTDDGYMGILCDEVSIEQSLDQSHELPPVMRLPDTPVLGLIALDEDRIACVSSAECLAGHIARQVGM